MNKTDQKDSQTVNGGREDKPAWHQLSQQQLTKNQLDLNERQQQRVTKSLTRLYAALTAAQVNLERNQNDPARDLDVESHKQAFARYLATYR